MRPAVRASERRVVPPSGTRAGRAGPCRGRTWWRSRGSCPEPALRADLCPQPRRADRTDSSVPWWLSARFKDATCPRDFTWRRGRGEAGLRWAGPRAALGGARRGGGRGGDVGRGGAQAVPGFRGVTAVFRRGSAFASRFQAYGHVNSRGLSSAKWRGPSTRVCGGWAPRSRGPGRWSRSCGVRISGSRDGSDACAERRVPRPPRWAPDSHVQPRCCQAGGGEVGGWGEPALRPPAPQPPPRPACSHSATVWGASCSVPTRWLQEVKATPRARPALEDPLRVV